MGGAAHVELGVGTAVVWGSEDQGAVGATGAQGPVGLTGATGPQGPAGPSGGLGKLSSYTAAGQTVTLGPGQYIQIDATCNAGDIAVSARFVQGTSADAITQNNQQLANQYATITITNNYTLAVIVQAVATCLHVG